VQVDVSTGKIDVKDVELIRVE